MDAVALLFDRSPLAEESFFARRLVELPVLDDIDLRDDVRAIAQRAWLDRAHSEYVGVMISRKFWGLLVDANAPVDIQELGLRMILDEQRHAHLCIAAATALGAEPEVSFDMPDLQQARSLEPVQTQLMEMVVQTYAVGEVTALGLIRHALSVLPDSGFKNVLKNIAADEVLHGRIGRALLELSRSGRAEAWLPWPGNSAIGTLVEPYVAAMRTRDVVERDEWSLFDDPIAAAQLEAVGIPHSGAFQRAYHDTLTQEVEPYFNTFLGHEEST